MSREEEGEELGGLPDDRMIERGEMRELDPAQSNPYRLRQGRHNDPGIMAEMQHLQQSQGANVGEPEIKLGVSSVFDTRPINSLEFMASGQDSIYLGDL